MWLFCFETSAYRPPLCELGTLWSIELSLARIKTAFRRPVDSRMAMAWRARLIVRIATRVTAILAGCLLLTAADSPPREPSSAVIDVLPAELIAQPPAANWLSYNGDFTGRRYSSLSQINLSN